MTDQVKPPETPAPKRNPIARVVENVMTKTAGWLVPSSVNGSMAMASGMTPENFADILGRSMETAVSSLNSSFRPDVDLFKENFVVAKSLPISASMLAFSRISYMPDPTNWGVIPWPGISPESLAHIVKENLAPQMIIGMRCDDIMRYSTVSHEIWRPGWRVKVRGTDHPTAAQKKQIAEAEGFLQNCSLDTKPGNARKRDAENILSFPQFLSEATRDSLTYDFIALQTDMDTEDRVKAFNLLPAHNMRLTAPGGYRGDPTIFSVVVDETNRPVRGYTRDEMTLYRRNPRVDVDCFGYGYPEIEIGLRLVQGFQNALEMNVDTFNKSAIPNGILLLKGDMVNQKQIDFITRIWTNLKKGVTKNWALPVIGMRAGDELEVVDLSRMKGMEAYYQDFMNLIIGAFCTVYRFPVRRLGYRISGKGPDTQPLPTSGANIVDEDDPGLAPLLTHLELLINEYVLWSRFPDLEFIFCGKSPKEDNREYEARLLAKTLGERRAEAGLPKMETLVETKFKPLAQIMELAPADPALAGIFQSLASLFVADDLQPENPEGTESQTKMLGARMSKKIDPAESEKHGGTSGVRRDSAAESE